jgi:ceramide glucosyltransferase
MIGAKRVAGKDLVVGKSLAMRREDLEAMGGFASVMNVLAEDWVMGKRVPELLGKRVAMGRLPIRNVSRERTVADFVKRYQRWAVIHRNAVGTRVFTAQVLLNPLPVSLVGCALCPSVAAAWAVAAFATVKIGYDFAALRLLRGTSPTVRALWASPVKDFLLFYAWAHGLSTRSIIWRSNRLRVLPGTRLEMERQIPARKVDQEAVA